MAGQSKLECCGRTSVRSLS